MFDKLSNKISAIKGDITEAVKERRRSISSDRHNSMSSRNHLATMNTVAFLLQDDTPSITMQTRELSKISGDTRSLSTLASSSSAIHASPSRRIIDHLALNTDFSGMKSNISKSSSLSAAPTKSSTSSLSSTGTTHSLNITSSHSQRKIESMQNISTLMNNSKDSVGGVKERLITKIDPVEMTVKPTIVTVLQDTVKRSAMLLAGPKFRLNMKEIQKTKLPLNSDTIYSISIIVGIVSLLITLWKPISSFFSGFIVGCLFAIATVYTWLRMIIDTKVEETAIEEWIDFPALDSMLTKVDKENKNTYIQVSGASMSFQSYDADRNDDFVRYPCDVRLDGYRLIIQLASKPWSEEKKPEKEVKFIGCREYLIKGKLSLVLRKGKDEIERVKYLLATSIGSLPSSISNSCLNRRQAQTDADTVLISNSITEANIRASVIETQINAEALQQRAKEKEPENAEKDASGTHRTIARKSKKITPNEASLQKVLQTPECLDEAAITINFMARRLLFDMFHTSIFKDLLKNKIEMKLKEIAVSILENLRVVSIDLGKTFPIILKIEPMQWNTQGIWFNLFIYYRGNFKLSIKSRVVLQKLINYDPKNDKPIFAQHQTSQIVHKDNENIDENDLIQRQKLLAKEPEIPEMAVTRKFGTALTNLALNKYFQMFVNLPFVKTLFEKFSQQDVGIDVELTSFSGILTLNIPPPPSDRIWVGFPEMPDLNIKVTPTYGEKQYSYILLQDFLAAKVRAELKRLVVLPAMDDQLLPFFRDWVIDIIGNIVAKPINQLTDNYKAKLNIQTAVREGLQEYKNVKNVKRQSPVLSTGSETTRTQM
ncbi:unnamed protein product [Rotaria sp. Silwood1]|nr:unnamed protein product [Rotaria sp. Silwood1]CAF3414958.1 unnamed protein product [Rotaria sp. Silwood1]CAF4631212.1 unnamed protein product [Rotaria sp. Silwood1]